MPRKVHLLQQIQHDKMILEKKGQQDTAPNMENRRKKDPKWKGRANGLGDGKMSEIMGYKVESELCSGRPTPQHITSRPGREDHPEALGPPQHSTHLSGGDTHSARS